MGIRRTFLLILLLLAAIIAAIIIVIILAFVLNAKVGLLASFAASSIIYTLLILIFFRAIQVNDYERLIVSRGGRFVDTGIQGRLAFLIRGLERPIPVDLRQRREDVAGDRCFTEEGIGIDIDYFFLWKVVDPMRFLPGSQDVPGTLKGIASAILKTEVRQMSLVDVVMQVVMQRDIINQKINQRLRVDLKALDKAAEWGVELITIDLRSMKVPTDEAEAMNSIMYVAEALNRIMAAVKNINRQS
jgi:regulator of protease activity HflC (stomatin/prohibitin superfamily)